MRGLAALVLALALVGPAARDAGADAPASILFTRVPLDTGSSDGMVQQADTLVLAPGATLGRWTSAPIEPGFGFTHLIASWNASTAADGRLRLQVQATTDAGGVTDWYTLAIWAEDDHAVQRTSVRGQDNAFGRVDTDTLVAGGDPFTSYSLRLTLERASTDDPSPAVRLLGAVASNTRYVAGQSTSAARGGDAIELPVPALSQEVHARQYPQYGGGGEAWCSPTSTAMVIQYWGRGPSTNDSAWVDPAYADPSVDHAARFTYDAAYRGTGNWPFNTAYAARFGLEAFVTQLPSLAEAEALVRAGIPLVASIAAQPRELDGFLFASGTHGHLVVIVGFDSSGNPIVNDPAAWSNSSVRRVYDRAQFERVWQRGSGGAVYVIHPAEVPLPG